MSEQAHSFKDPTTLTTWVTRFIYLDLALAVAGIASGVLEYQLLERLGAGLFATEGLAKAAAQSSDQRQAAIGMTQVAVGLITAILVMMWIYRANHNARQLGAADMKFTPGWAVGWYFVPVLALWKPYQAMKEIWQASADPDSWTTRPASPLLPWWWFLWLLSNGLGQAAFRLAQRADDIDGFKTANILMLMSDSSTIPLDLVFVAIIKAIYDHQMNHYRRRAAQTALPATA
jgi:hypothetical protein